MVAIGISEFTFGFAFLYEQTCRNWQNLVAAPVLPSLRQEADDAWDARLPLQGTVFYYQFKISDLLSYSNSKYIKDGTYNGPYYRVALHRRDNNRQHRRLKQHAKNNPNTYYVAPEVSTIGDFNVAFLGDQLVSKSRLIPINDCKDFNDSEQHFITFRDGDPEWRDHSEGVVHRKSFIGEQLETLYRDTSKSWTKIDRDFAISLFKDLEKNVHDLEGAGRRAREVVHLLGEDLNNQGRAVVLKKAAQLLSIFYGLTLVLVGKPED